MKRTILIALVLLILISAFGCSSHTHIVGRGNQSNQMMRARQWYIVFGLIPLNYVDSQAMAGGSPDYIIHTASTPVDYFINLFTIIGTVSSRTVTVVK